MLIDTHAHLDFPEFADDLDAVLERAAKAGVTRILTIGTNVESSRRAVALAERHETIFAVVGIHPNHVREESGDFIAPLREMAANPRVVAIGETGLDYHRLPGRNLGAPSAVTALQAEDGGDVEAALADGAEKSAQTEAFRAQLDLAAELKMNVVVHQRDAWQDTVDILKPYAGKLRAVFHCFGGTGKQAAELIADDHMVSFTGILTFKNASIVRETATGLAPETFMVETDCPFLAPAPHRGERCEPAHTRLVAEKIAELRARPLADIARETTRAAEGFFRFPNA